VALRDLDASPLLLGATRPSGYRPDRWHPTSLIGLGTDLPAREAWAVRQFDIRDAATNEFLLRGHRPIDVDRIGGSPPSLFEH